MEKKNIVFIAKSLDGFIAGKKGELDWLELIPNPDHIEMGFSALMEEIDAIVMGRNTYEVVLGFPGEWPYPKPVFVLSHTLDTVPDRLKEKVSITRGTPQEVLYTLHSKGYLNLYIDGGTTLQNFLKEDLIDELRITTIPVLLGGGFPLFGELPNQLVFEHVQSKIFLSQIVQNIYRRKRT